jgi:transposase
VNVLKPHLKNTVITLAQQGISQHEIHRKTGIDRKTIRHHVRAMLAAALEGDPNSSTPATGSMVQPELQIPPPRPPAFAAAIAPATPKIARSACEPHREWIEAQVRVGRNAMSIYQELVDERGFSQRYNSVKRFCRGLRQCEPEQFDRLEFSPGE